jgi:hypothetical protein
MGVSFDSVQQRRDEILSTTPEHFKQFGEVLLHGAASARAAAVTSADAAERSTQAFSDMGYTPTVLSAL